MMKCILNIYEWIQVDGRTALMVAAENCFEALVRMLLANGADKDLTDEVGRFAVPFIMMHMLATFEVPA
jgi:hypothetical protein